MRFAISFIWLLFLAQFIQAQNRYPMINGMVRECDGIFEDSNNGQVSGRYDHNERLLFTICVPGADYITFKFNSFCTEKDIDYLVVWNGKDTSGTKIGGPYSGTITIPTLTSSDSCVTFYFHSDRSVSCDGWEAEWETTTLPLIQPRFRQAPQPSCSSTVIRVGLDQKFICDSMGTGNFQISGVLAQSVTRVVPLSCNGAGETDSFELHLSPGFNKGGGYRLEFESTKRDFCDSLWILRADIPFSVDDCPIIVELSADEDTVCEGNCTLIYADITGGDSSRYVFQWNQVIIQSYGPVQICPLVSGFYSLRVSDGVAVPGSDSVYITVLPKPEAPRDTSLCQSASTYILQGNPSGGIWTGRGVENNQSGSYRAGRAGSGLDTVVYTVGFCSDTSIVTIRAINAGAPNVVCPTTASFQVYNFSPAGGSWSGNYINPTGLFSVPDTGVFTVTYDWNGCTDTKQIIVRGTQVQRLDTVCRSKPVYLLPASPLGGVWSGRGFLNSFDGLFYPNRAGVGDHLLIYRTGLCRDTIRMHVKNILAGGNLVSCPYQDSFRLTATPAGGVWIGRGIKDSLTGWYDPSFSISLPFVNDTLTYRIDGCEANRIVFVRRTAVFDKLKSFCNEDPPLLLDWAGVRSTPGNGVWSGPGTQGNYFIPSRAGHGLHKLYYTANGCIDSTEMRVFEPPAIQEDTIFCVSDPPFRLYNPSGIGHFTGPGITDSVNGIFNPVLAGSGTHLLRYHTIQGCLDTLMIVVNPRPVAQITPPLLDFCFRDTAYVLQGSPQGALGLFEGTGIAGNLFQPSIAGAGSHWLKYTYGTPTCYTADSVRVRVLPPISAQIQTDDDTLCEGEGTLLNAEALGGLVDQYSFQWSNGSNAENIFLSPAQSVMVTLVISDQCSNPDTAERYIVVHPAIRADVITSNIQCYGTNGFAELIYRGTGPFQTQWYTNPTRTGQQIAAPVGLRYRFQVTQTETGCSFDSSVVIPGYNRIRAYFITNPNNNLCLNNLRNRIDIINMSTGGTRGQWSMGDGTLIPYDPAVNPSHTFSADSSSYTIWLHIENEGACRDSFSLNICMTDSVYSFIPNAFTPDKDGINDVFRPMILGVQSYELKVFNRWGELLFQTEDPLLGWDGEYKDNPCPAGQYLYAVRYKGKKSVTKEESGVLLLLR